MMVEESSIQVLGLDTLRKELDALGERIAVKGIRLALRRAGTAFLDAMKSRINTAPPRRTRKGVILRHLAEMLRIRVKADKYGDCTARIGPTKQGASLANWLEFGTAPHTIQARHGHALLLPGGQPIFKVEHPGAAAKPFMRPAFDGEWERALDIFKSTIASYIEKKS
jgi:HK97 gp10 family phage protein